MISNTSDLYEYETQFFGFSPKAFTDTIYNIIIEKWAATVQSEIMPSLPLKEVEKEKAEALKKDLIYLICHQDKLTLIMDKLEQHLTHYVFRIPEFVTLPADRINLEFGETGDTEGEIMKSIKKLEAEILEMRLANQMLDVELKNTEQLLRLVCASDESCGITEASETMDCWEDNPL